MTSSIVVKITVVILFTSLLVIQSDAQPTVDNGFIPLWVADPSFYEVVQTQVFPLPDLTNNDILSFDRTMVAWNVRLQNQIIPMYVIIDGGEISDVTVFDPFFNIYWQNFASEVLLVGTTQNTTLVKWISPDHITFTIEIPGITENQSASFNTQINGWDVFFQNSTGSYLMTWDGFTSDIIEVRYIVIDSWQIFKLIKDLSDNGTYVLWGENRIAVPFSSIELKMFSLGILQDFPFLDLAIYNSLSNSYFKIEDKQIFNLPFANVTSIHRNIFPSSYFMVDSTSVFTYDGANWIDLFELSEIPSAIGSLTPTITIVTVVTSGVWFRYIGSDFDGDYLPDEIELAFASSPLSQDTEGDGMSDLFEYAYSLNPNGDDSALDPDNDGLTNLQEMQLGLDPKRDDTDWGGAMDGWEYSHGFDPLNRLDDLEDYDADGLPNYLENLAGTDPKSSDTDLDGLPDSWEYFNTLDPLNPRDADKDFDLDGLTNREEYRTGHHPFVPDNPFPIARYILMYFLTMIPTIVIFQYMVAKEGFQISDSKMG